GKRTRNLKGSGTNFVVGFGFRNRSRGGHSVTGKYEIKRGLRPGRYRVEIRSTETLKRKVPNPTIPSELVYEEVSVIPEQYNTKSREIREVVPGSNVLDFDLKGAAARR